MSILLPFLAFLVVGAFAAYHRLRLAYWAAITATLLVACWLLGANQAAVIDLLEETPSKLVDRVEETVALAS